MSTMFFVVGLAFLGIVVAASLLVGARRKLEKSREDGAKDRGDGQVDDGTEDAATSRFNLAVDLIGYLAVARRAVSASETPVPAWYPRNVAEEYAAVAADLGSQARSAAQHLQEALDLVEGGQLSEARALTQRYQPLLRAVAAGLHDLTEVIPQAAKVQARLMAQEIVTFTFMAWAGNARAAYQNVPQAAEELRRFDAALGRCQAALDALGDFNRPFEEGELLAVFGPLVDARGSLLRLRSGEDGSAEFRAAVEAGGRRLN